MSRFVPSDLVGTPYRLGYSTVRGADCWGLARLAFRLGLGIELPAYNDELRGSREVPRGFVADAFAQERHVRWLEIAQADAQPYDYVSLRVLAEDDHCGVVSEDGRILTISGSGNGARLDSWDRWRGRVCSVWRYVGEGGAREASPGGDRAPT